MFAHTTVLKEEAVNGLAVRPDGIYVDCTLGGAGHSALIASRLGDDGRLIAFDQDEEAIRHARAALAPYGERVVIIRSNFRRLGEQLSGLERMPRQADGRPRVNGVLFDLGVSSPQLDEAERGFGYRHESPLDMRMDRDQPLSAFTVVNEWAEPDIARILLEYGEEKFARRIAKAIVASRSASPVRTTAALAELVKSAIPAAARRTGGHPAKRSFQAIRIAVNDELEAFREALQQAVECLAPGGRVAVIAFHSLEDRICKTMFASRLGACRCPPDLPLCGCGAKGELRLINRKPIEPSPSEVEANPRARSAKLRIAEKL